MLNHPTPTNNNNKQTKRECHFFPPSLSLDTILSSVSMSGSPAKEAPAALSIQPLQPPPSPQTHRALRRLQSAHALGARAAQQATLSSQQRRERPLSPTRAAADAIADATAAASSNSNSHVTNAHLDAPAHATARARGRANSDATPPPPYQPAMPANPRRTGVKKPVFSHGHLSLQQIIREGPNNGDFLGALESARWKVIDEGVKAAEDGMVRASSLALFFDAVENEAWLTCVFVFCPFCH